MPDGTPIAAAHDDVCPSMPDQRAPTMRHSARQTCSEVGSGTRIIGPLPGAYRSVPGARRRVRERGGSGAAVQRHGLSGTLPQRLDLASRRVNLAAGDQFPLGLSNARALRLAGRRFAAWLPRCSPGARRQRLWPPAPWPSPRSPEVARRRHLRAPAERGRGGRGRVVGALSVKEPWCDAYVASDARIRKTDRGLTPSCLAICPFDIPSPDRAWIWSDFARAVGFRPLYRPFAFAAAIPSLWRSSHQGCRHGRATRQAGRCRWATDAELRLT
jgi:hypothetical protein